MEIVVGRSVTNSGSGRCERLGRCQAPDNRLDSESKRGRACSAFPFQTTQSKSEKKMLVFPKHTLERRAARAQDVWQCGRMAGPAQERTKASILMNGRQDRTVRVSTLYLSLLSCGSIYICIYIWSVYMQHVHVYVGCVLSFQSCMPRLGRSLSPNTSTQPTEPHSLQTPRPNPPNRTHHTVRPLFLGLGPLRAVGPGRLPLGAVAAARHHGAGSRCVVVGWTFGRIRVVYE
jgi:hypothetical protein